METKELVKMVQNNDPVATAEIKLRLMDALKKPGTKTENKD